MLEFSVFRKNSQKKFFHKPKIGYIHMDEMGSFIWPLIDGDKNLIALGQMVEEYFGERASPLYERLIQFFQLLESYGFIKWKMITLE